MSVPPSFPHLPGRGWSVHKRPLFSTLVASHVSGREVRSSLFNEPLYEFELVIDGLSAGSSYPGLGVSSLQALMGLYLQCQGAYGTFLYEDQTDNFIAMQLIAIGDGLSTNFAVKRSIGMASTSVSWVNAIETVRFDNDVVSGWSLVQPNSLVFSSAPPEGVAITADFSYAFLCRFLEDQIDFENIRTGLWMIESLKFRSVRS